ncbi:MAG: Hsp20/alpha crystallin family protein [Chloroflexi bacterium]|nr:Hsp20/alpha crystallin family protein [Chloroflexota bacterium]
MADMTLRSPFPDFNTRLNRLFEEGWLGRPLGGADWDAGTLALDISETDREVIVRASMPGFREADIEVALEAGVLSITARREEEREEKGERFYRRERYTGAVSRRVALPGHVGDASQVKAELEKGVLTVRVPHAEQAKPRKVQVKTIE